MKNRLCEMFGIDAPIFAFSHCRDVVVEVSKAGGFGVLGMARAHADRLEEDIARLDRFVQRFRYKKTKARQVQSRIKQLDRMERVEVRDIRVKSVKFRFPQPSRSGRTVMYPCPGISVCNALRTDSPCSAGSPRILSNKRLALAGRYWSSGR